MFSKSRINEPVVKPLVQPEAQEAVEQKATPAASKVGSAISGISSPKQKASVLSANLTVVGNLNTTGDVEVEGTIEGDIRAHLLTIGEGATIHGEVIADDIVINGHIIGRVRGLKVRLTSTAKVEGDIIHKTIAIESGAQFDGSVQRQEDPLSTDKLAPVSK